jgi:hypothetical protein
MNTPLSNAKEIRIPGPDHPITISPAKGNVRVTVAGRIVAESSRALPLEERGIPLFTTSRPTVQICLCSSRLSIPPIVRTRATARTTAFLSAK